jgi:hypothetical protein
MASRSKGATPFPPERKKKADMACKANLLEKTLSASHLDPPFTAFPTVQAT